MGILLLLGSMFFVVRIVGKRLGLEGRSIKNIRWIVIVMVILVVGFGMKYILSMPLISQKEAISVSMGYLKEDFILENATLTDVENDDLEWVKRKEGFEGRYLWYITFHNKERNKYASLFIDGRTGQLFDGDIVDTKTGKVVQKLKQNSYL